MPDLTAMRARALTKLTDTVRVTRPSDQAPVLDEATLELVAFPPTIIYEGPAALIDGAGQGGNVETHGVLDVAEREFILLLPGGTGGIRRDDEARFTAIGPDASPDLLQRRLTIARDDPRSRQVRTMLPCYDRHSRGA